MSSEESDSGVGSNSSSTTTAEQEKLSQNKCESKFVPSHSLLAKAKVCLMCAIFLLTAITDYIWVARRKGASVGTAQSKRKVKIDSTTSELDSQLMVSFLHLVSSAFSKLLNVEVNITSMRQFIHTLY